MSANEPFAESDRPSTVRLIGSRPAARESVIAPESTPPYVTVAELNRAFGDKLGIEPRHSVLVGAIVATSFGLE